MFPRDRAAAGRQGAGAPLATRCGDLTTDAVGRIKSASAGGIGTAIYDYDVFDNLKTVTQTDAASYLGVPPYPGVKTQVRQFGYSSLGRLIWAQNPESGFATYEYYPNGALKKQQAS